MLPWLPENVSTFGVQIDNLFYLIFWITGITFVLVQGLLLIFIYRYRARPGRRATYTHGNNTLEIVWTIVPSLILVFLALLSRSTWAEVKMHLPPIDYSVALAAKQFNWEFTYPGPDGKFETADDVTIENELHVPVNKKIRVILTSKDVIHSFFVPQMRLKQDAMPGRTINVWFEAIKPGRYEIPCAELCGFGHSGMKGWMTVYTQADYDKWVKERWPSPSAGAATQTGEG